MKKFLDFSDFVTEVTPILEEMHDLSKKYSVSRVTFLMRLSELMIKGGETGVFPASFLDRERNLQSQCHDAIYARELPDEIKSVINTFVACVVKFDDKIKSKTPAQRNCFYGIECILLMFKYKQLTFNNLAALFIGLEGEVEPEVAFPEQIVAVDEDHYLRHYPKGQTPLAVEQKDIESASEELQSIEQEIRKQ